MKIRKGDKVKVIAGKDKGRTGKVERVYNKKMKVLIPSINIYKKHVKKNDQLPKGGVVDLPRPIGVEKVMIICPKCKQPSRIKMKVIKNKKVRICAKCSNPLK